MDAQQQMHQQALDRGAAAHKQALAQQQQAHDQALAQDQQQFTQDNTPSPDEQMAGAGASGGSDGG
jgi:hypothetical protein